MGEGWCGNLAMTRLVLALLAVLKRLIVFTQHTHLILDGEHYVQQRNDIDVRHIPLLYSYSVLLLMAHPHA